MVPPLQRLSSTGLLPGPNSTWWTIPARQPGDPTFWRIMLELGLKAKMDPRPCWATGSHAAHMFNHFSFFRWYAQFSQHPSLPPENGLNGVSSSSWMCCMNHTATQFCNRSLQMTTPTTFNVEILTKERGQWERLQACNPFSLFTHGQCIGCRIL